MTFQCPRLVLWRFHICHFGLLWVATANKLRWNSRGRLPGRTPFPSCFGFAMVEALPLCHKSPREHTRWRAEFHRKSWASSNAGGFHCFKAITLCNWEPKPGVKLPLVLKYERPEYRSAARLLVVEWRHLVSGLSIYCDLLFRQPTYPLPGRFNKQTNKLTRNLWQRDKEI